MDMRVANAYNTYSVYNIKNAPGTKKTDRAGKAEEQKDSFSLSMQAGDYQAVRNALANVPDIRGDKVKQIMAQMEANTYNVSASDTAAKMLKKMDELTA